MLLLMKENQMSQVKELVLFSVWEDASIFRQHPAPGSHPFDMDLSCLRPASLCFLIPEFPQGAPWGVAAV